ncbi:MAG: PilZ domain-containing protein [Leptonema sp. (in: Bacteria)]|nr:PilZ domain-containing protein [Leptonema sp. (in: bacteria)]
MENQRQFPRIVILNLGVFIDWNGNRHDVINVSEAGLCLRRKGAPKFKPGEPIFADLEWPAKSISHSIKGIIVWSRTTDDGDTFYGVHADVDWLMEQISISAADNT